MNINIHILVLAIIGAGLAMHTSRASAQIAPVLVRARVASIDPTASHHERSVPTLGFDLAHAGQVTLGIGATGAGLAALLEIAALASGSSCEQSCGMLGEFLVVGLLGAGAFAMIVGAILWSVGAASTTSQRVAFTGGPGDVGAGLRVQL